MDGRPHIIYSYAGVVNVEPTPPNDRSDLTAQDFAFRSDNRRLNLIGAIDLLNRRSAGRTSLFCIRRDFAAGRSSDKVKNENFRVGRHVERTLSLSVAFLGVRQY